MAESRAPVLSTASVQAAIDEDWEEWSPEKGSFVHHMLAGSAAGVAEHVSIFPIDTIKTHMQCQRCPINGNKMSLSAIETTRRLVTAEGPLRLFRGVSTMLGASLPAHSVYFSVFEAAKRMFGADTANLTPIASGTAGVCATVCHDLIMTPMDVVKQRLQLGYYKGVTDGLKSIVQREGVRALYLSFPTTLIMNLPYSMIMVSANESFKKVLNPSGEMNVSAYIASGAMAGALAGVLTNPLDVAKTLLQTQSMQAADVSNGGGGVRAPCGKKLKPRGVQLTVPESCTIRNSTLDAAQPVQQYRGLVDALVKIRAREGYAGYFRGVGPRLLVHAPSVAVSWTTFEVLKKTLDRLAEDA